ncbi:hypothetical protein AGABI2DRAFT_198496 [Agaricus bisporus var. bisporus H97]|uniref:hypothetical protein n=1 Tax=Agaricus bisporus var. bisporus (strain H97 / ATCC MYA-4626 / FGSC 10389) TaxID=936046 RepID=UPI00029F6221|nr:hypothetical protein AGABI2DRAFT_198496 [Agaricus bisporus var. bisporus H97]EKV51873.1 hypothetical protein AGABI2DRAFT_198496 [Agaricus bisporus var. bisporus H97]
MDPTTQSNYDKVATEHVEFDWRLDFENRIIQGSAVHQLTIKAENVHEAIFDTNDLTIDGVSIEGKATSFDLKPKHEVMGSALHVSLPSGLSKGAKLRVQIQYQTSPNSMALQWLEKEQTQGKQFPYLFSQCQPIYSRALAPLQDSPSAKITYSAKVKSVLPVLLSAIRVSPPADGPPHGGKIIGKDEIIYSYNQPVPIATYLIAIAAGNIHFRSFPQHEGKTWTSGIWTEPELLDAAYWEFSEDTTKFLAKEESLVIPYGFGVYDLLVLPPSFPYGGMENACLTFLTPTLVTGDRTLVDVVVHELTHSWFGNGVTHAEASHFWLNEGWTTYMERVLQQFLHSPAHRGFSYLIGNRALRDALEEYKDRPKYQRLIIGFEKGEDPDDAYSSIPYEKGANFLFYIEQTLGGLDVFLPYVKDYVSTFIGKSIRTEDWKSHLYGYFKDQPDKIKALNNIDWDAWFYGEGTELPVQLKFDTTLATQAYALAKRWDEARSTTDIPRLDFKETDLQKFDANQIVVFLEKLQSYSPLPSDLILHLGRLYGVSSTSNAEIRLRFYGVALQDASSPAAQHFAVEAAKWVIGDDGTGIIKGRMKFCRPTFRSISKVNHDVAVETFMKAKNYFHPIARKLIEKDLKLA